MQRFFDIVFSLSALMVLLPILILVVLVLKFTGEGEILFLQERVGKYGRHFQLFKFATMLKNSPNIGTGTVTVKGDPRILPFGHFLRRTKINELPQLLNVLFGDMSLIGPRPLTNQTFSAYGPLVQEKVKMVRPGLSGIGSIIFRDEEEILSGEKGSITFYNEVIAPYKGSLEVWYAENRGIVTYFKLIFVTAWVVMIPGSALPWSLFNDLPCPPVSLTDSLGYVGKHNL